MKKVRGGTKRSIVKYLAVLWTACGLLYFFVVNQFFHGNSLALFENDGEFKEVDGKKEVGNGKDGVKRSVTISEREEKNYSQHKGLKIGKVDYERYGSGTPVLPDNIKYPKTIPAPTENYPPYSNLLE